MAGKKKEPPLEGARLLRAYIDGALPKTKPQSVPTFCERNGLDRVTVQRYLKGERNRPTVGFAAAIERATNGAVPIKAWAQVAA
jgi:hypothetical protein